MKHLSFFFALCLIAFCSCEKADPTPGTSDPFDGSKLAGKWTPTVSTITLKLQNGKSVNGGQPIKSGDFLDFKYVKTEARTAEGTFSATGAGLSSSGEWDLENWDGRLTFYIKDTDGNTVFLYRRVQSLDAHKLVLTADDALVMEWVQINGLNTDATNPIVGGSAYEEYTR